MISPTSPPNPANFRSAILLTAGVTLAVLLGIFLAQADSLLRRLPAPIQAVADTIAGGGGPTVTLPATVVLPTATPSPSATSPVSPTPATTKVAVITATPTAVPLLPTCGQIPANWVIYVVQPGDSLFRLSSHSGATVSEIVMANCLHREIIYIGLGLFLPPVAPTRPPCGPPLTWVRYTIQQGDTLFSLARRRGTTVYAIRQANCLSSSTIYTGTQIYLPLGGVIVPATATPLPTFTATPSSTPTIPATASSTATTAPSPTAPFLPTFTATPSATPLTATPTETAAPTATATDTPAATPTMTNTPPAPPTATATLEPTATPPVPPTATETAAPPTNTSSPTETTEAG